MAATAPRAAWRCVADPPAPRTCPPLPQDCESLQDAVKAKLPTKIDIGPVYNWDPRDRVKYQKGEAAGWAGGVQGRAAAAGAASQPPLCARRCPRSEPAAAAAAPALAPQLHSPARARRAALTLPAAPSPGRPSLPLQSLAHWSASWCSIST
jgi:hypothetical protein